MNAPVMVDVDGETDPLKNAEKELRERRIPVISLGAICRTEVKTTEYGRAYRGLNVECREMKCFFLHEIVMGSVALLFLLE